MKGAASDQGGRGLRTERSNQPKTVEQPAPACSRAPNSAQATGAKARLTVHGGPQLRAHSRRHRHHVGGLQLVAEYHCQRHHLHRGRQPPGRRRRHRQRVALERRRAAARLADDPHAEERRDVALACGGGVVARVWRGCGCWGWLAASSSRVDISPSPFYQAAPAVPPLPSPLHIPTEPNPTQPTRRTHVRPHPPTHPPAWLQRW